jgi:hypothetical protein
VQVTEQNTKAVVVNEEALRSLIDRQAQYAKQTQELREGIDADRIEDATEREIFLLDIRRRRMLAEAEQEGITEQAIADRKLAIHERYAIDKRAILDKIETERVPLPEFDISDIRAEVSALTGGIADDFELVFDLVIQKSKRTFAEVSQEIALINNTYGQLANDTITMVSSLMDISMRNQSAALDARIQASRDQMDVLGLEVEELQRLAGQATGERSEQIQQEANLRKAVMEQERQRMIALEREREQALLRQARRQKAIQLFGATLETGRAILKVLTESVTPFPARFAEAASAGIIGGIQVANIAATPLPTFEEGGFVPAKEGILKGKRHAQGGVKLEAEGGEWIFSREKTRQFRPLFEAIQDGKVNPQQMQAGNSQPRVDSSLAPLADALRNLKQVHVNLDAKGFRVAEQTAQSKTQYLNTRYRA